MARNLDITKKIVEAVLKVLEKHKYTTLAEDIRSADRYLGNTSITLVASGLPVPVLKDIVAVIPTDDEHRQVHQYLKSVVTIAENPGKTIGALDVFPEAFYRWMSVKSIDGWLYQIRKSGATIAWAVQDCTYTPENGTGENYQAAYCTVKLLANRAGSTRSRRYAEDEVGIASRTFYVSKSDISGRGVHEVVMEQGYYKETPELKTAYESAQEKFSRFQPMANKQFVVKGIVLGSGSREEGYDFNDRDADAIQDLSKCVSEEGTVERVHNPRKANTPWLAYGITGDEFTLMPVHHYLLMYALDRDQRYWVHVNNLSLYEYDKTLTDKLVLPVEHRDLIDILVTDMDIFVEDIVAGKSGGTAILCFGEPGLGKTLTAEVYSEIAERPLYKVHSGQLGTTFSEVEENLTKILKRAERWGAILLLDEADVYVAKRGNDLERNAVVAAFLRALEYFNGLMFLTTNRIDDIDDAIVSRMVALFRYERPDAAMARKLWTVIGTQFDMELTDPQLDWLVKEFTTDAEPGKSVTGRDIKQLLKLVKKYCSQKKVKISTTAFRVCAVFRGIK